MKNNFFEIQELLRAKGDYQARLNTIAYEGSVEVKEISGKKYLYTRRRIGGKASSSYVGIYTPELHQTLLLSAKEAREIRKKLRTVEKSLAALGYTSEELSAGVIMNLEFARANIKSIIYDQAVLEGISTTFPDTELIIENGIVNNVSASDVQKILNLKHAWEFILDKDVITSPTSYYLCQYIARLINEGFYQDGGRIRAIPVRIGGSSYVPPIPLELEVKERIESIVSSEADAVGSAIELALFVMKTQLFTDGNKRTAIIFANHFLISRGAGLLVVPEKLVPDFKKHLIDYYEDKDLLSIKRFLKDKCYQALT